MAALTNPDPTTEKPPRRRRWIPLSLRMFAALLASLGVASLWLGACAYRQMAAIREIEQAGGSVHTEERSPELLRHWVGDRWMQSLDILFGVDLKGSDNVQAAFPRLRTLTHLKSLSRDDTPVTDPELVSLRGLARLTDLSLDDTPVSDAGLEHLQELTRLKELSLCNTEITDTGLKHLRGLAELEDLRIDNLQITDSGLEQIAGLTRLELLSLRGAQVTDAGLSHLKGLASLKYLWLDNTRVTDDGLAQLKGLTQLVYLSLRDTQVTDAGLVHFRGLTRLGNRTKSYLAPAARSWKHGGLNLMGTQVTDKGTTELKKALPGLALWR